MGERYTISHGYEANLPDLIAECEREAREGDLSTTLANLQRIPTADFFRLADLAAAWWTRGMKAPRA